MGNPRRLSAKEAELVVMEVVEFVIRIGMETLVRMRHWEQKLNRGHSQTLRKAQTKKYNTKISIIKYSNLYVHMYVCVFYMNSVCI